MGKSAFEKLFTYSLFPHIFFFSMHHSPSSMHHHTDVEGAHLSLQSSGVIISFAIEKQEQKALETQLKHRIKQHKLSIEKFQY